MLSSYRLPPRLAAGWALAAAAALFAGPAWADPAPSYAVLLERIGQTPSVVEAEGSRRLVKDEIELVLIKYTRGRPPLGDMSIQLPGGGVEFTIVNLDVAVTP